jgi:hypothetical protein
LNTIEESKMTRYAQQQHKPWRLEHPEYLMRPIAFAAIHQAEGHDDYSGDIDGLHIDHTLKCAFLIDIKYRRHYAGELKPHTKKTYEAIASAMTAGGIRTYVIIAGHDVDLHTEGAMVPIDRCQALEVYYPKSSIWQDHAVRREVDNGLANLPLDMSLPAVIHRLKVMGDHLDEAAWLAAYGVPEWVDDDPMF